MLLFVGELIKEEIELYIKSPDEDQIEHFGDMYEKVFEYLVAGDTLQCRTMSVDVCPDMEFFTSPCLDMPEEFFQCGGVSGRVENCGAGRRIGAACGKGI